MSIQRRTQTHCTRGIRASEIICSTLKSGRTHNSVLTELALQCLDDSRPLVVASAIDALRQHENVDAKNKVMALLDHSNPFVKGSVLRFISQLTPSEAKPYLLESLYASDPIVQQNAIDEIGDLGIIEAIPLLRPLLFSSSLDVQQAAGMAIANLEYLSDDSRSPVALEKHSSI